MTLALQSVPFLAVLVLAFALPAQDSQGKDKASGRQDKPKRPVGGAVVLVQDDFAAPIKECTVSKDGAVAVICTEDGFVCFNRLDTRLGRGAQKAGEGDNKFRYRIQDAFLSATGERLIGRVNASTVAILTKKPKVLHLLRGMPDLRVTALHPDGVQFAGGMKGGLIRVWDTSNGKCLAYLSVLINKEPTWLGFSPDGRWMIAGTEDKKLWWFLYPGAEKKHEVEVAAPVTHVTFTADGATMVSHAGEQVQVWEVAKAKEKTAFDTGASVIRTAVSADGRTIAVAHEDGSCALHDGSSGERKARWQAHPGKQILCLQFIKPRGGKRLLVTAARKGDVVCWDFRKLMAGGGKNGDKGNKNVDKKRGKRRRKR